MDWGERVWRQILLYATFGFVVFLKSVSGYFPVYPDSGTGSEFDYETGNAELYWNEVSYWDDYPYDIDGGGNLDSGTGLGYYGTDVAFFTDANQVDGATKAINKIEIDYHEEGDSTGTSNAYFFVSFRVYKKSGSAWIQVGSKTFYAYVDYHSLKIQQVNYEYDSSEYKYRVIQKVYFDEPKVDTSLETEITDGDDLYVED